MALSSFECNFLWFIFVLQQWNLLKFTTNWCLVEGVQRTAKRANDIHAPALAFVDKYIMITFFERKLNTFLLECNTLVSRSTHTHLLAFCSIFRKTCQACKCPRETHSIYQEQVTSVRERLGLKPSTHSTKIDANHLGYTWLPPGIVTPTKVSFGIDQCKTIIFVS